MKRLALPLCVVAALSVLTFGCPIHQDGSCNDTQTCGLADGGTSLDGAFVDAPSGADQTAGDAMVSNEDGGADATTTPDGDAGTDTGGSCDPTQTPAENACVISDALAFFVAPTGSDSNAGTMDAPVATLATAIALASASSSIHRVIACAGVYPESVRLISAANDVGLALFGGVLCPGSDAGAAWTYTGATAVAAPVAHGFALSVSGLAQALDLEDFEFDAQNGTAAGESSVAGFIDASPNVTLRRVKLAAGTGADGAPGTLTAVTFPTAATLRGDAGAGDTGGEGCAFTCPAGGATTGGNWGSRGGRADHAIGRWDDRIARNSGGG